MPSLFFVAAVILIVALVVRGTGPFKKVNGKYQYKRKEFLITRPEHECFNALESAIGEKYHVFPQVSLASLLDHKVSGQGWRGARSHINRLSVDFVLCDKNYLSPLLAIELDDRSHERQDRVERDAEVERILAATGLPLLRLKNHGGFAPSELLREINDVLSVK